MKMKPVLVSEVGLFFLPESLSKTQFNKLKKAKIFEPNCKDCELTAKSVARYHWDCPTCRIRYHAQKFRMGDEEVFIYFKLNDVPYRQVT